MVNFKRRLVVSLLGGSLLISPLVLAEKPDKNGAPPGLVKNKLKEERSTEKSERAAAALPQALTAEERQRLADLILEEQYGIVPGEGNQGVSKRLPSGLAKKLQRGGELPPGWQMKFQRGEVVDAETYRRAEKLPTELLSRITGREDAGELLQVGDRILRVSEGRGTILDVIDLTDRATRLLSGE